MKISHLITSAILGTAMALGAGFAIKHSQDVYEAKAETASVTFSDKYSANTVVDGTAITIVSGLTVTFNKSSG